MPIVTDGHHFVLDFATGPMDDPKALGDALECITGVVDHGLFIGLTAAALFCDPAGAIRELTPA